MALAAPEKVFKSHLTRESIILRGDVFAAMEYSALTGRDLRDDAIKLLSLPIQGDLSGYRNANRWADLFFAFSASWREDECFDSDLDESRDRYFKGKKKGQLRPIRERARYKALIGKLSSHDLERARGMLQELVVATLRDPSQAAGPKSTPEPAADTESVPTGTTPAGPPEPDTDRTGDSSPDSP